MKVANWYGIVGNSKGESKMVTARFEWTLKARIKYLQWRKGYNYYMIMNIIPKIKSL